MPYQFTPATPPKTPGRKPVTPVIDSMTSKEVKERARSLLVGGLSPTAWHVIDILAQTGVATLTQLNVSRSVMLKYGRSFIVSRLQIPPHVVRDELNTLLPGNHLYTLGPVGIELAKMRGLTPSTGHMAYPLARVMHDVILTEILLRISRHAVERGWSVTWHGTAEAALFDAEHKRELLEPDALLRLTRDGQERLFAVEYHNEDKRSRAERKVDQYENVAAVHAAEWMAQWETDTFPALLAVFQRDIVGKGYVDKLAGMQPRVRFYGKLLGGVLKGNLDEWLNLSTRTKDNLFSNP